MRRRAVAPPLGDIAVGTMLIGNRSFVRPYPPVSLTLNKAPAKDALMSSPASGLWLRVCGDGGASTNAINSDYPVTMVFQMSVMTVL